MANETRMIEFRVMTMSGSGAIEVVLMGDDLRHYYEEKTDTAKELYVKHIAWRKIFDTEAGRMLKQLIADMGVDRVKSTFNNTSHIVEIARG
jgi:hypothetical protein